LSRYSTLGVGGPADFFVLVKTLEDLVEALDWARANTQTFVIIGGGSNILVSDTGFRGLVIINHANHFEINTDEIVAESGAVFCKLAKDTLDNGLLGLHFGAGIPGTVGGAIVGNAGALGFDISKTLVSAKIWNHGDIETWENADFGFSYRNSKLKNNPEFVLLSATFSLKTGNTKEALVLIREDRARRAGSYLGRTCGSYFKNPGNENAGKLIDSLGLKGYRVGGAEVSPLHANVIRNIGNAKAADILALEEYIQDKIYKKYNFRLEPEVVKIGF